jgi:hypothetical protein
MRDDLVGLLDAHLIAFDAPFVWGHRDCVTFTAEWVRLATGRSLIPVGLTWNDEASARAALAQMGCADTRMLASRYLEPKALLYAHLGDIVGKDFPRFGFTLGICTGAEVRFVLLDGGLHSYELLACSAAWAVEPCLP